MTSEPRTTPPAAQPGPQRPAVFLDRDGTVIEFVNYLSDPSKVRLLPDAASSLRQFQAAGYALVVVTNQSPIGRGLTTVEQYERVNEELIRQLAAEGVTLDGIYHCPEVPIVDDPTIITHHDRKPGPGMLLRAAREHNLDISRSWMVGDVISDVLAGINAGCRGSFLVETGKSVAGEIPETVAIFAIKANLSRVADVILGSADGRSMADDSETSRSTKL